MYKVLDLVFGTCSEERNGEFEYCFIYFALIYCRDAWAKHKDIDSHGAKQLYVEALLKVSVFLSDGTSH